MALAKNQFSAQAKKREYPSNGKRVLGQALNKISLALRDIADYLDRSKSEDITGNKAFLRAVRLLENSLSNAETEHDLLK